MQASIKKNDIVLADRYFPSYFLMADVCAVGADGILKGQSQRRYDFRKGHTLGKYDHIVQWKKPARPQWMSQESYEQYPDELTVREFKVDGHVYVTTFLAKSYHKRELAKIYKLRWRIEINLNSIKSTMNMDRLSCKSPEMVRKEIGIHFLAYNLIRIIIAQACCQQQALSPREISFKGTVQLLKAFMPYFVNGSKKHNAKLYARMLSLIVKNKIGNRPGRVEPRAIKQRHKPFKTLDKPRHIEKIRLKKKVDKMIAKYAEA